MDPNYIPQAGQYIRLKRFIKAKEASHEMEEEPRKLPNKLKIKESGEEIRTFYETLTSEEIPTHSKALLTPPATPSTSKPRNKEKKLKKSFEKAKFFKLATENDLEGLRELTLSEEDINSTDDYGWTALMMASCENASETVKFLLDLGAKTDIADKKGHTALSLAQQKGFRNIIDLLDNDSSEEDEKVFEKTMKRPKPEKFFCEECNEEIKETKRKHFSSIVHQFNRKLEERPYRFQIPSENRGLKLMVKQGWDKQSGLGPTNSGHLFPIKTTIRKPRSGVGIKQTPARVTHFKPFDLNAIKYREPSRGKNRSEMAREKRRDRRLDRKKMSKTASEKTIEILIETERVADQILQNKQEIIALDRRRQHSREAIREIEKNDEKKVWTTIGSLLVKLPREKALELLKKDQVQIDVEINKLRSDQKILVNKHRDLEHNTAYSGTNLKPMSAKDMSALKANLPLSTS